MVTRKCSPHVDMVAGRLNNSTRVEESVARGEIHLETSGQLRMAGVSCKRKLTQRERKKGKIDSSIIAYLSLVLPTIGPRHVFL